MNIMFMLVLCIMTGVLAFAYAVYLYRWVRSQPQENAAIRKVCGLIQMGARTFLNKQNRILIGFAGIVAFAILLFLPKPFWKGSFSENLVNAIAYIGGTLLSALSGKIGIEVATIANGRSAYAAKTDLKSSFMVGFRGGAVMGMAVVGACVLGVSLVYLLTGNTQTVLCFSLGASSLALFAKVGGGIFTKTADIAADLTGKVELGIPEDDPRNPAVIADNVGDNVGDVAGMGADLFDSNVASLAAALVIAQKLDSISSFNNNVITVFCYAGLGLLASLIGVVTAKIGKNGNPTGALNSSTYVTTGIYAIMTAVATALFHFSWRIWTACILGLLVGVVIGITTDYFTDDSRKPVHNVAHASKTGPAFTILSGISYGFLSALPALVGTGVSTMISYKLCEGIDPALSSEYALFGISIAAVGMLSIVGMIVSNDAYGPIVDNARGLAEMGGLGDEVLEITDELDSAGNTVKAITKGFSIAAAGLTVIALLGTFMSEVNDAAALLGMEKLSGFDVMDPLVFFGMLVGAAIPAVFSAMLILGVNRNAQRMVEEIHRQFNTIEGLREGKCDPEYNRCIDIATSGAIRELIPAGASAILSTIVVGLVGGVKAIGGFLVGNILSGLLLSLFMSNSGGLWDNAKKFVEAGNEGGKGSEAHKAAVVGDTVGDPFKDTAGPSINTQITVVSLIASLLSTLFLTMSLFK
ncbi:MAG: sodium-translocating pyrophosphatase [Erysipelotrichaceae bacterium]|nr:sodium-translocating pyrophosphatase [Erysipelotrichaceae bacterium]